MAHAIQIEQLLEAGAHFGHLTRRWNPKMQNFIFMERNGIHIIDLRKTQVLVDIAKEAMYNIAMFYQDTKAYDKALDEYKMILQIDSKHTNANHNIGWIQLEIKKNYPEALNYFSQSIKSRREEE